MNPDLIDQLLRKAPPVRTPAGLLEQLEAAIQLPRATATVTNHPLRGTHSSWFRRWLPALGFTLWFLGCLVVFGFQASRMAGLLEQQRALESAQAAAAQQALSAEAARLAAVTELEQLKKQWAEVQKLRPEIEQLRAAMQELAALRAQNQQLREELKAQVVPAPKPEEDFFAVAQARAERIECVQNLKQLGLAARIWSNDHGDKFPASFLAMSNELVAPKVLVCPGDAMKTEASDWSQFNASANVSYEFLKPGAKQADVTAEIIFRCPVHGHTGLGDGSVRQGMPATRP